MPIRAAARERRAATGAVFAVIVGMVATLVIAELILRVVMPNWSEFYSGWFIEATPVPGHGGVAIGRPGFDGYFAQNNGDFRVHLKINAFGLRNDEPISAADGRVWVVGDSMTFGWGIERDEMYDKIAERGSGRPTYNIASPGSDICGYQALLARMPKTVEPRAVIVGLILENDLREYNCPRGNAPPAPHVADGSVDLSLPNVKRALTQRLALYNFFAVSLKRVAPVNRALIALGLVEREHRQAARLDPGRTAVLAESAADELAAVRAMLPEGTPFAVLMAPSRWEIRDSALAQRRQRLAVGAALARRGIETIDVLDGFVSSGFGPTHFAHDGHWSPLGHRIAGEAVAEWIKRAVN